MKARFIITGGLFLALSAHPTAANAGDEVKLFSLESLIATGERNAGFSDRDGHNFDIVGEPLVTFEAPRDIVRAVVNKYDSYEYQAEGEPHRSVGYSVRIFIEVERSIVGDSGGAKK